jgi:hypothetical protein
MEDGVKRPQPDLSFDDLYKQAGDSVPVLEKNAQNLLDRLKTQNPEMFESVIFEMGSLKEPDRALAKINSDYGGDPRQIKDLVRGRFVVDTPEQITAIKQAMLGEFDVDTMNDKYLVPTETGYRDLNTKIGLENGHIAEIQVQQRDMLRVNKVTHGLMEEAQEIKRLAKAENRFFTLEEETKITVLENQARELHAAAAHDGNLNTLVKAELREQFAYKGELDTKGSALGKLSETLGNIGKRGGLIGGAVFGTLSSAFALASGSSKTEAAEIFYETAMPYGETELALARGNLEAAAESALIETASNGGSLVGAAAGAAIGTLIMPGVGTAIGTGIGLLGGGIGAGYITEKLYDNYARLKSGAVNLAQETAESLTSAVEDTKRYLASWFDGDPELDVQVAFASLPDRVTPDMPPEVAALVEVKASQTLFEQRFAEIEEHDGLPEVLAYIEAHPQDSEHSSPAPEKQSMHYAHLPAPGMG